MRSNKIKDMIRSVLPSTDRGGARHAKSGRKRHLRRAVRLSDVIWSRRSADKLNHFMRWCRAKTKGMDTDDALGYVRSILPSSLIGDHAYGHWEECRNPWIYSPWYRVEPAQSLQSFVDSTTFRLRRALREAPYLHHALNAEIKRRKLEGEPRRLLRGIHDVDAFVRDVAWPDKRGEDDLFPVERRVTLELIERVEKGGREAALPFWAGPLRMAS